MHDHPSFSSRHEHLKHDYRAEGSQLKDSCMAVALELAEILQQGGLRPRILTIRGQEIDAGHRETLIPLPYEGRIAWGAHMVCELDGVVYDPMHEKPLPLEEYLAATFDQSVELEDRSDLLDN